MHTTGEYDEGLYWLEEIGGEDTLYNNITCKYENCEVAYFNTYINPCTRGKLYYGAFLIAKCAL